MPTRRAAVFLAPVLVPTVLLVSLTTAHAQGMLRAPTPPAPKANADLVGLIIENLAAHPLPASPVTFGQAAETRRATLPIGIGVPFLRCNFALPGAGRRADEGILPRKNAGKQAE